MTLVLSWNPREIQQQMSFIYMTFSTKTKERQDIKSQFKIFMTLGKHLFIMGFVCFGTLFLGRVLFFVLFMELQLKYHKNIWDKLLLGDLHILKVTGWLAFQLTLLRQVFLNQNNHMTRQLQLFFHKVMGNLDGMCHHHVSGTANPLSSRSRSGNMLQSCTTSNENPLVTVGNTWWQQDTAQGMSAKTQINCIWLLHLLTPLAGVELSLPCSAYLTDD